MQQPYIVIQYPYDSIQIALCEQGLIIKEAHEHKFNAIKLTLPIIQNFLDEEQLTIKDIAFIGANVGPCPYNTIRALLTMANSIHFCVQTPLISLNAFDLIAAEFAPNQNSLVVLQAFAQHVFYQFQIIDNHKPKIQPGACNIDKLISQINNQTHELIALGNGIELYCQQLLNGTQNKLIISTPIPSFNSIQTLAKKSFEKFQKLDSKQTQYLEPIYFESLQNS